MDDNRNRQRDEQSKSAGSAKGKRPYKKPGFLHEKVFETMALACGKLSATQAQCRFNRRTS
jgi:hypothetical protein